MFSPIFDFTAFLKNSRLRMTAANTRSSNVLTESDAQVVSLAAMLYALMTLGHDRLT